jgi:hypothetical protein
MDYSLHSNALVLVPVVDPDVSACEPAFDYTGWNFDRINAEADELRAIRAADGVGAMLAHATGVPAEVWRGSGGVDQPAGR